jgi:hypothetical protein
MTTTRRMIASMLVASTLATGALAADKLDRTVRTFAP